MYRSSTSDLSYFEDPPRRGGGGGGGGRWDRERFERAGRHKDFGEHERFHFEEHDRSGRNRRDIEFDDHYDRRPAPRVAERERERFFEEDRFDRPRRHRTDLFDEPTSAEVANRALAPYRRKSIVERDIEPAGRRPARPQFLRRQSSLDTFDRKPLPRYGDVERDEWRPPKNVPIPLPIREKRRSPPRRPYREEDYEEIRYADIDPREEYREVEVKREKSRIRRSHSRASRSVARSSKSAAHSSRSSSTSSFEDVAPVQVGRKGKTRMPKRLVKKQAVVELGYPFEEETDFIIVQRALEKEHIDEIIKISESYKEPEKTTYVYEDKKEFVDAPPPPPPAPPIASLPPPPPPPPPEFTAPPPSIAPSHHSHHTHHTHHTHSPHTAHSVRSSSPSHHEVFEERIEESNHIGGPLTVLVPEERKVVRHERDIKDEIRALEHERRFLKYEREGDYEVIERREPRREVVRVDKDRKGAKNNPKLVAAMMATLT